MDTATTTNGAKSCPNPLIRDPVNGKIIRPTDENGNEIKRTKKQQKKLK